MEAAARLARVLRRIIHPASPLFLVAAFVVLVCLVFVVSVFVDLGQQRKKELEGARLNTTNLARSLAQHAEDTFRAADLSIFGIARRLEIDGTGPDRLEQLTRIMAGRLEMSPAMLNVLIVDANGNRIASGRPIAPCECEFRHNAGFAFHRTHPIDEPSLGAPIRTSDGTWFIPWSRRFNDREGQFAGAVVAAVSVGYLRSFYDTFDIGRQGAILLARSDGLLLLRRPFGERNIGRDLSQTALFRLLLTTSPSGSSETRSFADGVVRLFSFRRVGDFPLVVTAAMAKDEVLEPWRADARSRLLRTGGLVVMIAALGAWLALQIRKHQQLEHAYREAGEAFRMLAENSTDLIVRLGPDMRRLYVSPASRQLLGYEPEELVSGKTSDIVHPEDRELWEAVFGNAAADATGDLQATYRVLRKDGAPIWVEVNCRRLAGGSGLVLTTREVTRRKEAENQLADANRQLAELAARDALTGLANRRRFDEVLAIETRRAWREQTPLALIMIDVDHFKRFNDRYGHPAGDRCLADI